MATRAQDNLFDTLMLGQLVFLLLFIAGGGSGVRWFPGEGGVRDV